MNDLYKNVDAVCCVLAAHRSRETIDRVLRTFVPNCEQLSNEYVSPPDDLGGSFSSPDEIIDYFVLNTNRAETFFWNQYENNPERIMIGAFFTEDGHLIISLTIPADGEVEHKCLAKLKTLLLSDVGVISYTNPPSFEDGADFISRYST
jgi:hypothetical protein